MGSLPACTTLLVVLTLGATSCAAPGNEAIRSSTDSPAAPRNSSEATEPTGINEVSDSFSWSVVDPVILTSAKVHFGDKAARAAALAAIGAYEEASFDEGALTAVIPEGREDILAVARRWMTPSRYTEFVSSADSYAATGKDDDNGAFTSWTWWGTFSMKGSPGYRLDPNRPLLADPAITAVTVSADGAFLRVVVKGRVDAHYLHKTKPLVQRMKRTTTLSMLRVRGRWLVDGWSSTWSSAMVPADS